VARFAPESAALIRGGWLVITIVVKYFGAKGAGAMKLTYDPRYNIGYLQLHEKTGQVETIRISDELNVDMAPDGTVYGIELLNANEQLHGGEHGALVIINEAIGDRHEIPLSK